jgi:hypothetical protein
MICKYKNEAMRGSADDTIGKETLGSSMIAIADGIVAFCGNGLNYNFCGQNISVGETLAM